MVPGADEIATSITHKIISRSKVYKSMPLHSLLGALKNSFPVLTKNG